MTPPSDKPDLEILQDSGLLDLSPNEAVKKIARHLLAFKLYADARSLRFLSYLIGMALMEAQSEMQKPVAKN